MKLFNMLVDRLFKEPETKKFGAYFPYSTADFKTDDSFEQCSELYTLKDGSVMRVYECSSMVLASEESFNMMATIVKLAWPKDTVIQITLLADNYIDPILDDYAALRADSGGLFDEQKRRLSAFYRAGLDGMPQMSGSPIRNFRLFISFTLPVKSASTHASNRSKEIKEYLGILSDAEASLNGMKLSPRRLAPDEFITLLVSIMNPDLPRENKPWDLQQTLDRQILYADTPIEVGHDYMKLGNTYAACITPKTYPKEVDFFTANSIIGLMNGTKSNEDDSRQIRSKFMFTLNILKGDLKQTIAAKGKQVEIQQAAGSFAPGVAMRKEEYRWAFTEMERGEEFVQIIPVMWCWHRDKERLDSIISDVKSIWKSACGMESQREQDYLLPKLLISSLPGGMYGSDTTRLQRDWIVPISAAVRFAALNGGYRGNGKPYLLFIDRRGQLCSFDFFNTAANRNILITGGSGGGKSFLTNYIVSSHLACGFRVRIIDVGESYAKLSYLVDGTYIYPVKENTVVNFFETLKLPNLDADSVEKGSDEGEAVLGAIAMLTSIIATMVYSRTAEAADEQKKVLIELAIKECYANKKQETTIDDIAQFLDYLADYYQTQRGDKYDKDEHLDAIQIGHFLSSSLQPFTTKGEYGRYFNGKSNINLDNQLVVTELNQLPPDLKKVMVLAVASIISDEVYRGQSQPTLIFLDEAWQTLSENPAVAEYIEGMYRKIRKHNGGVGIATQSVMDFEPNQGKLKHLGNVLMSQSAYHFIILDPKFHKGVDEGIVDVSEFEEGFYYKRMPDAKSIGYKYSEIFIKGAATSAVVRLMVDPFSYLLNTSDPDEREYIQYLAEQSGQDRKTALLQSIITCADMIVKLGSTGTFGNFIRQDLKKIRAA